MTGTIEKYLSQIMEVTHVPGIYAYRGQQDLCWPLHSAATRRLIERYGKDLLEDPEFPQLYINYHQETLIEPARTRGFGTDSGRRLSDLELLAKLQHFGAATGLLDFTWSPLVALWFACEDTKYDGKLLINQYQGGMCISGSLTMTERTPRHLISPLGPSWVGTDSAV